MTTAAHDERPITDTAGSPQALAPNLGSGPSVVQSSLPAAPANSNASSAPISSAPISSVRAVTPPGTAHDSALRGQLNPLALALLGFALLVPSVFVAWRVAFQGPPPFTGGSAAALVAVVLGVALVLEFPTLIQDDGGGASTMRILSLLIVFTFCALMLRTGWNVNAVPSLENQGNWVWLVSAALGSKALQKFAEKKGAPA